MDLRTSEFHLVGETVKQFASDDATVVVGYVIDPEMTDQIRVTVVATGIGRAVAKQVPQPTIVPGIGRAERRRAPLNAGDYSAYDTPPRLRDRPRAVGDGLSIDHSDESFIDIPAFLRRQAD
jgi:cell division protein FtsZ